jgi:hypothetical protein
VADRGRRLAADGVRSVAVVRPPHRIVYAMSRSPTGVIWPPNEPGSDHRTIGGWASGAIHRAGSPNPAERMRPSPEDVPVREPAEAGGALTLRSHASADRPGSPRTHPEPVLQDRRSGGLSPTTPHCLGWQSEPC